MTDRLLAMAPADGDSCQEEKVTSISSLLLLLRLRLGFVEGTGRTYNEEFDRLIFFFQFLSIIVDYFDDASN